MIQKQVVLISILAALTGCSLSFQNISTHGTATDLIDQEQTPTSDATVDLKAVPV